MSTDSWTTGTSASGHAGKSTAYMPWSKPRSPSSRTGMPAAVISSTTLPARAGEPGAGYWMRYISSGKPP